MRQESLRKISTKKLTLSFLTAVVVLLFLECSARILFTLYDDSGQSDPELAAVGLKFSPDLGWERKPNFNGNLLWEPGQYKRKFDSQGFFGADKGDLRADRVPRIITIGDSTTFGWGVSPESSFPEVLGSLLPHMGVINSGVPGYSSYQGYRMLLKYAPVLQPALIIVSFNYNDRRYVLSEDAVDSDTKFFRARVGREINNITKRIYLYRVLRSVMWRVGIVNASMAPGKVEVEDVRKLHARVSPENYRENLKEFAQFGKERHIPLIFMILKDNPAYTEYLRQGINLFEKSQYGLAVQKLEIAVSLRNPFSDIARKYLALALEKQGIPEAAKQILRVQNPQLSAMGGNPVYLDVEYNNIMWSVAKEYGIEVVDAGKALDEDPSMYVDFCHPNKRGYEKIAYLLYPAVNNIFKDSRTKLSTTTGL